MSRLVWTIAIGASLCFLGCASSQRETAPGAESSGSSGLPLREGQDSLSRPIAALALGQDGEMLPIAAPALLDAPPLPTDRESLLAEAQKAASGGRKDDALSILDTLLVLEPSCAELLERRAELLQDAGEPEDAAADLERCCSLGRRSCCPK